MVEIHYESVDFDEGPPGLGTGAHVLHCSMDDLLWAALTVGRPDLYYVFKHGNSSFYEARFRTSLIRLSVDPVSSQFRLTAAARAMDPTEKGMVSYFLGMAVCKLLSARLLNAPWALHIDVFKDRLPFKVGRGQRPDLVAATSDNRWHVFESKGRSASPSATVKAKAKHQADSFQGFTDVDRGVASIAFFRGNALQVHWADPPARKGERGKLPILPDDWRHYFSMVFALISASGLKTTDAKMPVRFPPPLVFPVAELDISLEIDPRIAALLFRGAWSEARTFAAGVAEELREFGLNPDGIRIRTGASWQEPLKISERSGRQ